MDFSAFDPEAVCQGWGFEISQASNTPVALRIAHHPCRKLLACPDAGTNKLTVVLYGKHMFIGRSLAVGPVYAPIIKSRILDLYHVVGASRSQ